MSAPPSVRGTLALVAQIILGVAIANLTVIAVASHRDSVDPAIADPARPFYPGQSREPVWGSPGEGAYWGMITHSPIAVVTLGLFVVLVVITAFRAGLMRKKFGKFGATFWPLAATSAIGVIGFAIVGPMLASPNTDVTFSTWAQERYGLEIEAYPASGVLDIPSGGISTHEVVTLDSGQKIRFKEVTDARGKRSYVITDLVGGRELPRVDSEAPKPPSPDTQRQLDDRRDMKQSAGDDSTE